jgi:hypothetical protein|tara:strand:- start:456 stop:575 length:120 start_codon:yes stop_codon:yes gene_type:complete
MHADGDAQVFVSTNAKIPYAIGIIENYVGYDFKKKYSKY